MLRASIIRKSFLDGKENLGDVFEKVAIKKIKDEEEPKEEALLPKEMKQGSEFTPYILLIALSFHGLFEGVALGLAKDTQSAISLMIAILAHKWAESLTLGLSFTKAETPKSTFIKMICIFASFTPLGIGIGMGIGAGFNNYPWVSAAFMSFSVGTFIYIGAAEIIVEEFSISRYKWQKFFMYLLGGLMIAGLTIWEITTGGHDHGGDDHDHDHDHDHGRRL